MVEGVRELVATAEEITSAEFVRCCLSLLRTHPIKASIAVGLVASGMPSRAEMCPCCCSLAVAADPCCFVMGQPRCSSQALTV